MGSTASSQPILNEDVAVLQQNVSFLAKMVLVLMDGEQVSDEDKARAMALAPNPTLTVVREDGTTQVPTAAARGTQEPSAPVLATTASTGQEASGEANDRLREFFQRHASTPTEEERASNERIRELFQSFTSTPTEEERASNERIRELFQSFTSTPVAATPNSTMHPSNNDTNGGVALGAAIAATPATMASTPADSSVSTQTDSTPASLNRTLASMETSTAASGFATQLMDSTNELEAAEEEDKEDEQFMSANDDKSEDSSVGGISSQEGKNDSNDDFVDPKERPGTAGSIEGTGNNHHGDDTQNVIEESSADDDASSETSKDNSEAASTSSTSENTNGEEFETVAPLAVLPPAPPAINPAPPALEAVAPLALAAAVAPGADPPADVVPAVINDAAAPPAAAVAPAAAAAPAVALTPAQKLYNKVSRKRGRQELKQRQNYNLDPFDNSHYYGRKEGEHTCYGQVDFGMGKVVEARPRKRSRRDL